MVERVYPMNFQRDTNSKFFPSRRVSFFLSPSPSRVSLSFSVPKKAKKQQVARKQEPSQIKTIYLALHCHPTNGEDAQSSEQHVFRRLSSTLLPSHVIAPSSPTQAQRLRLSPRRDPSASKRSRTRGRTALGSRNGKHGKSRE